MQMSSNNLQRGLRQSQDFPAKPFEDGAPQSKRNAFRDLSSDTNTGKSITVELNGPQKVTANVPTTAMSRSTAPNSVDDNGRLVLPDDNLEKYYNDPDMIQLLQSPHMNPELAVTGCSPDSNQIREQEELLIDSKKEKLFELFKASGEVHDIL